MAAAGTKTPAIHIANSTRNGSSREFRETDSPPIVEGALAKDSILRATVDEGYLIREFAKLDSYLTKLKTLAPTEGSRANVDQRVEEIENPQGITIKEYEDLFGSILDRNKAQ